MQQAPDSLVVPWATVCHSHSVHARTTENWILEEKASICNIYPNGDSVILTLNLFHSCVLNLQTGQKSASLLNCLFGTSNRTITGLSLRGSGGQRACKAAGCQWVQGRRHYASYLPCTTITTRALRSPTYSKSHLFLTTTLCSTPCCCSHDSEDQA